MPGEWLLAGLYGKEINALQMLIPAVQNWTNVLRVLLLYGAGLLAALWPRNTAARMDTFRPTFWRGAVLVAGMVWSVLSFTGIATFIYSNF